MRDIIYYFGGAVLVATLTGAIVSFWIGGILNIFGKKQEFMEVSLRIGFAWVVMLVAWNITLYFMK